MTASNAITISGVSKRYDRGTFVSLLGPSGCGKSTTLNMIAGFENPSSGHITVEDEAVSAAHPSRAVVFQEPALFPWLTVWENVIFGPKVQGLPRTQYETLARELIAAVRLEGFEQHLPEQLSGGMKQRVGIARALILRPKVLLMDEPFGALDAQTRLEMQELLLEVWERYRKTVVFVTHDLDEAILLSDVIYVMSAHPGEIRRRIEIKLPRPRTGDLLMQNEFNLLRQELFSAIRAH
jgi:NitT/TauT family transport system ATP-binding protein